MTMIRHTAEKRQKSKDVLRYSYVEVFKLLLLAPRKFSLNLAIDSSHLPTENVIKNKKLGCFISTMQRYT